jgi:hypothetical protein
MTRRRCRFGFLTREEPRWSACGSRIFVVYLHIFYCPVSVVVEAAELQLISRTNGLMSLINLF